MKKILFLLFYIPSFMAFSQNYVPNPSFEYFTACPSNNLAPQVLPDELAKAYPWKSYSGSPDYFNPCVTNPNLWCDAPNTGFGYQQGFDGECFTGFGFNRNDLHNNNFETFGCPLAQPLSIGERYYISLRVSLSEVKPYAANHIGALLLTSEYDSYNAPITFPDKCHACTDSVITEMQGWAEISAFFEADSAYTYIAIGHFLDSTTFINLPGGNNPTGSPYYFVDYICVVPEGGDCSIPLSASQPHQSAAFTAYPNPIIKSQSPILHFSKESSVEVYDLMGQSMGYYENVLEVDAGGWPAGGYLLKESGGGAVTKIIVME